MDAVAPARLVVSISVTDTVNSSEIFSARQQDSELPTPEVIDQHGTRLHLIDVQPGRVEIDYDVTMAGASTPVAVDEVDLIRYTRQSRYCESDQLFLSAKQLFAGLTGPELVLAVGEWVHTHVRYQPGYTRNTDTAAHTMMMRRGVCRDFSHLAIALLRGNSIPARMVSTYAPGLTPMDFHALVEAYVDGAWWVIDPTNLAPRGSLMRIATGRDAADIAWLSALGGQVNFVSLAVNATDDHLQPDDHTTLLPLGA
jgi:transglutaminase-like putative cysteine protease